MIKNEVFGPYDRWSMVVLYDPKTGNILHTHQAVSTRGGTHPDQATLEKQAAEHASRSSNISVEGMAFLAVDPHEIDLDGSYTVDLKSRTLRQVAPRSPKHRHGSSAG